MSEVNVNITDDNKRADYLEFIFREAFAHPAVDGFLFWYTTQGQEVYNENNGHCTQCLGNLDYSLNAAGQRVLVSKESHPFPKKLPCCKFSLLAPDLKVPACLARTHNSEHRERSELARQDYPTFF